MLIFEGNLATVDRYSGLLTSADSANYNFDYVCKFEESAVVSK